MSATEDVPVGDGASRRSSRRVPRRAGGFGWALGWTTLNALLPGTAFLVAGRRVLGGVTLALFLALTGAVLWFTAGDLRALARTAVDTDLLWFIGGIAVVTCAWIAVIVAGYRMLVPAHTSRGRHLLGGALVLVLVLAVTAPAVAAGRIALVSRDLIAEVFDDGESATVEETPNPFGGQERVNVLLLGGDGGEGREGVRTDTVIVASIDTETGETTLFSLPRNLEDLPFPADSPLAEVYPDGFDAGSESESLLNAVYRNGPAQYPDILGPTTDPGADFLKLGVGEALGLHIDNYVLVNLEGFSRLVDALGGITVNVNYYVPIGGEPSRGVLPDDYIEPGPDQHLNGDRALDFARGRFGLTDYDRMDRQRCALKAIIDAADPVTLLRKYQEIASTTQDIVSTDIRRSALDDYVDLAFLVKDAPVRSVVFNPSVIDPAHPDYDEMRRLVREALNPPRPAAPVPDDASATASAPPTSSSAAAEPTDGPTTDVEDACAYDPEQAAEARAAGEPPTRRR